MLSVGQELRDWAALLGTGSVSSTGRAAGVTDLGSIRELLAFIRDAPANVRTFKSGPRSESSVSASFELTVQKDGTTTFSGRAHESGLLTHNYVAYMIVNQAVVDSGTDSLQPLIVAHKGTVHGTAGLGSRDDEWSETGRSLQMIRDNWRTIRLATWVEAIFGASTGAYEVLEGLVGLPLGAVTGTYHLVTL